MAGFKIVQVTEEDKMELSELGSEAVEAIIDVQNSWKKCMRWTSATVVAMVLVGTTATAIDTIINSLEQSLCALLLKSF